MRTIPGSGGQTGRSHGQDLLSRHFGGLEARPFGRVATSSPEGPGWASMRRGSLPPSPIDQLTAAMPPGALVVCFALTPYGVIHQGPHVRSSLMSSPVDNSTHSIF